MKSIALTIFCSTIFTFIGKYAYCFHETGFRRIPERFDCEENGGFLYRDSQTIQDWCYKYLNNSYSFFSSKSSKWISNGKKTYYFLSFTCASFFHPYSLQITSGEYPEPIDIIRKLSCGEYPLPILLSKENPSVSAYPLCALKMEEAKIYEEKVKNGLHNQIPHVLDPYTQGNDGKVRRRKDCFSELNLNQDSRKETALKVFVVGFHKVGYTSITRFFKDNGISSLQFHIRKSDNFSRLAVLMRDNFNQGKKLLDGFDQYIIYSDMKDTYKDLYAQVEYFKVLDWQYRNSKFILNVKSMERWFVSLMRFLDGNYFNLGYIHGNYTDIVDYVKNLKILWNTHINDVKEYFKDRPGDLLEFNIEKDEIEKLITFFEGDFKLDGRKWIKHNVNSRRDVLRNAYPPRVIEKLAQKELPILRDYLVEYEGRYEYPPNYVIRKIVGFERSVYVTGIMSSKSMTLSIVSTIPCEDNIGLECQKRIGEYDFFVNLKDYNQTNSSGEVLFQHRCIPSFSKYYLVFYCKFREKELEKLALLKEESKIDSSIQLFRTNTNDPTGNNIQAISEVFSSRFSLNFFVSDINYREELGLCSMISENEIGTLRYHIRNSKMNGRIDHLFLYYTGVKSGFEKIRKEVLEGVNIGFVTLFLFDTIHNGTSIMNPIELFSIVESDCVHRFGEFFERLEINNSVNNDGPK